MNLGWHDSSFFAVFLLPYSTTEDAGFHLHCIGSLRKQPSFHDATTSFYAKKFWLVLLIGCVAWEISFNQSEALPGSG